MSTYKTNGPLPDFSEELSRIATHDAIMAQAKDNAGNRSVCPYCYQPAMGIPRNWYCGCP
jgi:hypothetical protein